MRKTAVIFGGTGAVGRHVLKRLIDDEQWDRVVVVTRRSLDFESEKVVEVVSDATRIEEHAAELKGDTVFCCLGTTQKAAGSREQFRKIDHDYIVRCAEITRQQGATRFLVISTLGAKEGSPNFYSHVKGETEQDLKAIGFDTLDILRPSLLVGERSESRPMEEWGAKISRIFTFLLVGPLRKYRPIEVEQVAKAMFSIALQEHEGVAVHRSDELASY